jgi:NPCBM/NEW2 domain
MSKNPNKLYLFVFLVLTSIVFYGNKSGDFRFLSESDLLSNTWEATVDYRENQFEIGVKYPFFIGDTYYSKGISIPLRESVTIKVEHNWKYASFILGVDQFLFPETKVGCQLLVWSDGKLIYSSPELTEKSKPINVSLPVSGLDTLKFELKENSKFVFDSPNNWADVNYLGADLVNFVWSKEKEVDLSTTFEDKAVNEKIGMEIHSILLPSSAWVVKYLPNCGPGSKGMLLAGCFDNNLYAMTPDGKRLWETQLKGVPHKIDYCFEGEDLRIGVLNWSVNTDLSILDETGKLINTIEGDCRINVMASSQNSFYTVDYNNKLKQYTPSGILIKTKELSNLTGRPMSVKIFEIPEIDDLRILIGTTNALFCYDNNAAFIWKRSINPTNLFLSSTHEVELVQNLGKTCFVIGSRPGSVSMVDYNGHFIWRDRYVGRGHSAPEITTGNFAGTHQTEIAAVSPDGVFHLFNLKGQRIKRWDKKLPFVDLDNIQFPGSNEPQTIIAASMGPRDKNIYLLNFNPEGVNSGFDLVPDFRIDHVTPTLLDLKADIDSCSFYAKNKKDSYVCFLFDPFGGNFTNPGAFYNKEALPEVKKRLEKIKTMTDKYSDNNVHFLPMFDLWSCVFHKERRPIQNSELNLQVLEEVEKIGLPFAIFTMHGKDIISIEDLRKLVRQNKNTLKAIHISEAAGEVEYKKEIMELAKEHGIKILFGIHQDYWLNIPQEKEEFDILFNKQYHGVLIPVIKSNPGSFDLNWMSTLGLLEKGFISEWGVASQCWNWNWYTRNIDALYPLDLLFRHDFQAASLGATWYLPEGDFTQDGELTKTFFLGREPFYKMLRKGFFPDNSLEQNKRLSPIKIQYNKADEFNFVEDNRPGDFLTTGFRDGLLQTTPDNSFSKEITGIERYINALFPKMPYGFVSIVPEDELPENVQGWSTDGISLYHNGEKQAITSKLKEELKSLAERFPVQSEDAFLSVQEIDGSYFIYISSIGYLYPEEEEVTIRFNFKTDNKNLVLTDIIKDKLININGDSLILRLKPGEVRVLMLQH